MMGMEDDMGNCLEILKPHINEGKLDGTSGFIVGFAFSKHQTDLAMSADILNRARELRTSGVINARELNIIRQYVFVGQADTAYMCLQQFKNTKIEEAGEIYQAEPGEMYVAEAEGIIIPEIVPQSPNPFFIPEDPNKALYPPEDPSLVQARQLIMEEEIQKAREEEQSRLLAEKLANQFAREESERKREEAKFGEEAAILLLQEEEKELLDRRTLLEQVEQKPGCEICLEEIEVDKLWPLYHCGHLFHSECMKDYVAAQIDDRKFPLRCPKVDCKIDLSNYGLARNTSLRVRTQYTGRQSRVDITSLLFIVGPYAILLTAK